jgi:predicted XRE-type DNA-binding protein
MTDAQRQRLEADGWRFGNFNDFLGLTDAETKLVQIRVAAIQAIRRRRDEMGMTQAELAKVIGSSQPRVARALAGAPDVTLDLLLRMLFTVGGSVQDLIDAPTLTEPTKSKMAAAPRKSPKSTAVGKGRRAAKAATP